MPSRAPDLLTALADGLRRMGQELHEVGPDEAGLRLVASWGPDRLEGRLDLVDPGAGAASRSAPQAFFARLAVGEAAGKADRWGVVRRGLITAQAATGPGWASLAAPLAPSDAYSPLVKGLLEALDVVRPVGPQEASEVHAWVFEPLGETGDRPASRLLSAGGTGLTALSGLAAAGALLFPEMAFLAVAALQSALPAGLVLIGAGWLHHRALLRAHEQGAETARAIKDTRLFGAVEPARPASPIMPPLVVPRSERPRRLHAALHRGLLLRARAGREGLDLGVRLDQVQWPEAASRDAILLPSAWATAELHGPAEVIARVPEGPRETRRGDRVRWLFSQDELQRGRLPHLLVGAAERLAATGQGPYR